eukprot:1716321-Amphidinium_carterae.1
MQCVLGTTEESNETLVDFKADFRAFDSLQKGAQKHPDVQKLLCRSVFQTVPVKQYVVALTDLEWPSAIDLPGTFTEMVIQRGSGIFSSQASED